MGVQDLQSFLEGPQVSGGSVPVDLLRIARGVAQRQARHQRGGKNAGVQHGGNKLSLVVDGECCLDRLYGGYFSVQTSHIELAVFFNGCLEQQRMAEWVSQQQEVRRKINQVLKHINTKGTPPPKVWWTAPVGLRTCLRMALRHLSVGVLCTMDDHHQEVIAYCRENGFHGLMADDGEYAVFDPPRYFSSEHLKLTYKGSLETKEYILSEVAKGLGLNPDRFCVLAALLGNYLLTENDLADFYRKLGMAQSPGKIPIETLVKNVAAFVKSLPTIDNLDSMAVQVFGSSSDKRAAKLKQSVQYYLNGTKDGFLRYRPQPTARRQDVAHFSGQAKQQSTNNKGKQTESLDTSRFASETAESERDSLALYKEATANATKAPQIVIEPPGVGGQGDVPKSALNEDLDACDTKNHTGGVDDDDASLTVGMPNAHAVNGGNHSSSLLISSSSSSSSSSATSPSRLTPEVGWNNQNSKSGAGADDVIGPASNKLTSLPIIPPEVMQAEKCDIPELRVKEWIWSKNNQYQTPDLVKAEQIGWGVPTIQRLWFGSAIDDKRRRLRAFLTCMRSDTPLMLNRAYVPQHLLVMASVLRYIMSFTDKKILRKPELDAFIAQAFSPELMNSHYLQELQLPLVTSRGVQLAALFMQGVETALLANDACGAPIPWLMCCSWLFFDGKLFHHKLARTGVVKNLLELCDHHIEHVVKVERMRKAILEGLNVQFARPAIPQMPGPRVNLAPSNIMPAGGALVTPRALPISRGAGGIYPAANGASRGMLRRAVPTRGGQLEIAGVVVGSWGPNYGTRGGVGAPHHAGPIAAAHRGVRLVPPQVTSVGGLKPYRQGAAMTGYHVANVGPAGRPTFHTRGGGKVSAGAGRGKKNQAAGNKKKSASGNKKIIHRETDKGKGRGMTVEAPDCGNTFTASELLNNDVNSGGGGDTKKTNADSNKIAPGQFDDATSAIPNKSDSISSPKKSKDANISLSLIGGIDSKGQGDGPATSVLAGVPSSGN
ncbi:hypothetical protein C0J52_15967 [Blattella germanica]|nr:hypothetical protein C0J52_15967 [Blattella germanica]